MGFNLTFSIIIFKIPRPLILKIFHFLQMNFGVTHNKLFGKSAHCNQCSNKSEEEKKKWIRMDVSLIKLGLTLKLRMTQLDESPFTLPLNCSTFLSNFFLSPTRTRLSEQYSISNISLEFFPDMYNLQETTAKSHVTQKKQEVNLY